MRANVLAYAEINKFAKFAVCALLFTALFGVPSSVFSQTTITAAVPVTVNVGAAVTITPPEGLQGASGDSKAVLANTETVLNIVLESSGTSLLHAARMRTSAPVRVSYSHGNVLLKLSPQIYGRAEISLFTVNGRRILNNTADASQVNSKISRSNIAPGVYLLSVKGADGNSYQTKISHRGGRLNINVAFGHGNAVDAPVLARMNANTGAVWTINVTTSVSGYRDTLYTFTPAAGMNPLQEITLSELVVIDQNHGHFNPDITYGYYVDPRDGRRYRTIVMPDGKTWMAQNLNYETAIGSWCAHPDTCIKYGRFYDWAAAMNIDSSYNNARWGGSDELHQGACPPGWHLPSSAEWDTLMVKIGGIYSEQTGGNIIHWETAGERLKAKSGWEPHFSTILPNGPAGTDDYGFSALGAGAFNNYAVGVSNPFGPTGTYVFWWHATEYDTSGRERYARGRQTNSTTNSVIVSGTDKNGGRSVRCVRE